MQTFVRSTFAEALLTIRRERLLPTGGDVVVRPGQQVTEIQVVARTPQRMNFHILPASDMLRISPDSLAKQLVVKVGGEVEQGSPLVRKRGLFGKTLVSPIDGVLHKAGNGRLVLRQTGDWLEVRAMMKGRVVNQIPNRGVVIEADGSLIQALWGNGREAYGKIGMVAGATDETLIGEQLNEAQIGQVIVVARLDQPELLERIEGLHVKGLIAGSMPAELCLRAESLSFPVIITDGIGGHAMARPIFELLKQSDEREATLFAGIEGGMNDRPEVVIVASDVPKKGAPDPMEPLEVGSSVRILRRPYSSQVGTVSRLYSRAQNTSIGTKAPGADVQLPDGQVVFVPYVNLEIMAT